MAKCPWYISVHAVKRYLHLMGRPIVEDGRGFEKAEEELMQMAIETVASDRVPKQLRAQHLLQYRGPAPQRLQFIVSSVIREEGALPQLVDVAAAHAGLPRR
jgi:hypothetical protein